MTMTLGEEIEDPNLSVHYGPETTGETLVFHYLDRLVLLRPLR